MTKKILCLVAVAISFMFTSQAKAQDTSLNTTWAAGTAPASVDGHPSCQIASDKDGNIYQAFRFARNVSIDNNTFSLGVRQVGTLLVKYNDMGAFQWARLISPGVRDNAIMVDGDKVYLALRYSPDTKVTAEKGDNGIEENTLAKIDKKFDEDILFAVYNTSGDLLQLKSVNSNIKAKGRAETIDQMIAYDGKIYALGFTECYSPEGANPSFNAIPTVLGATCKASMVMCLNQEDLKLEKLYMLKTTSDDDVTLNSIVLSKRRVFVSGNSNALSDITYNEEYDKDGKLVKGGVLNLQEKGGVRNATICAELDLNSNQFAQVKSLAYPNTWFMSYCMTADKDGGLYFGGTAFDSSDTQEVALPLQDGSKSPLLMGAFVAKWDMKNENPDFIYPVGKENEENVVKGILPLANGDLYLLGEFEKTLKAFPQEFEAQSSDCFMAVMSPKDGSFSRYTTFGSDDLDELQTIHYNKDQNKLYYSGYYGGGSFNIFDGAEFEDAYGYRAGKLFMAYRDLSDLQEKETPTAIETVEKANVLKVAGREITWLQAGAYTVFALDGTIVAKGYAVAGETLSLPQGIYIIKHQKQVVKLAIR